VPEFKINRKARQSKTATAALISGDIIGRLAMKRTNGRSRCGQYGSAGREKKAIVTCHANRCGSTNGRHAHVLRIYAKPTGKSPAMALPLSCQRDWAGFRADKLDKLEHAQGSNTCD